MIFGVPEWFNPYRWFLVGARMNPEPDDKNLVPISDAEAYRAIDAVEHVNTLAEMGIYPTARWQLTGRCSKHGLQTHTIETNEDIPQEIFVGCWDCGANNIHRLLPVIEKTREPAE